MRTITKMSVTKKMSMTTDGRIPTHLVVLVGVTAGAYAMALAGVAFLQADADARLNADRAPVGLAAKLAADEHDQLEAAVEAAARRYLALAAHYDRLGGQVTNVEAALDGLASRAATLSESAASLPTRFSLPTVVRSVPRVVVPAPKTSATTGASG
jgi:hypothetical protein